MLSTFTAFFFSSAFASRFLTGSDFTYLGASFLGCSLTAGFLVDSFLMEAFDALFLGDSTFSVLTGLGEGSTGFLAEAFLALAARGVTASLGVAGASTSSFLTTGDSTLASSSLASGIFGDSSFRAEIFGEAFLAEALGVLATDAGFFAEAFALLFFPVAGFLGDSSSC